LATEQVAARLGHLEPLLSGVDEERVVPEQTVGLDAVLPELGDP
jgi:hypothetical protein